MAKLLLICAMVIHATLATPTGDYYGATPYSGPHYNHHPLIAGYTAQIFKPDLGAAITTPYQTVTHQRILAAARPVHTITPQITQIQPELTIQNIPVDVPVAAPYISQVEYRSPIAHHSRRPILDTYPSRVSASSSALVHGGSHPGGSTAIAVSAASAYQQPRLAALDDLRPLLDEYRSNNPLDSHHRLRLSTVDELRNLLENTRNIDQRSDISASAYAHGGYDGHYQGLVNHQEVEDDGSYNEQHAN